MRAHCPPNLVTRPRQWTVKQTPFCYQLILCLCELELGEGRSCLLTDLRLLTHRRKGRGYGPAWKAQAARAIHLGRVGEWKPPPLPPQTHRVAGHIQREQKEKTSKFLETQGQYRKRRSHL